MRRRRHFLFNAAAAAVLIFGPARLFAMGDNPRESGQRAFHDEAEAALTDLSSAYESRDVETFMGRLDGAFEGRLEFKAAIQDKFFSSKNLEIKFVVDSVLTDKVWGDRISVRSHWFKKAIDPAGRFSKTKGYSQLVFKRTPGGLTLLHIRGDNPFR